MPPHQNSNVRRAGPRPPLRKNFRTPSRLPEYNSSLQTWMEDLNKALTRDPPKLGSRGSTSSGVWTGSSSSVSPQNSSVFASAANLLDENANVKSTLEQSNVQNQSSQTREPVESRDELEFRERLWSETKKGEFSDVILTVGNLKFPVLKTVLSIESPYFYRLFKSNMGATEFAIPNVTSSVLCSILEFIYRGKLDDYGHGGRELRQAAEMFELSTLLSRCPEFAVNKQNVVKSIVESSTTKNIPWQNAILAYVRAFPNEAREISNSNELANLDQPMAQFVRQVLYGN